MHQEPYPPNRVSYELYKVNPMLANPAAQLLPPVVGYSSFRHNLTVRTPVRITFDSRRILGIPTLQPLPRGVPANFMVNLRKVLNIARRR
jgi:hypothetical protein